MNAASALCHAPRAGFGRGYTAIATAGQPQHSGGFDTGMDFGIRCCNACEEVTETHASETVWLLLRGAAEIEFGGQLASVSRESLFEEAPTALHLGPDTPATLRAVRDTEWAVIRTANSESFTPRLILPRDQRPEYRGAGLVQNTGLREVRLVFDRAVRPKSNLVVGEVVNFPGRWSSYPPHHHDQPEIYHYRFTLPLGYGHAELGESVHKVRHGDTLFIPPGLDHAQVSAPGYGMYYLWFIRHLPDNPYNGFTFADEHKWTLDPAQQGWFPRTQPPRLA